MSSVNNLNPTVVSYGMVSGANTQSIIQAELQPFEIPINNLKSEQSTIQSHVADYQQINSDLLALKTATDQLASPSGWNARSATSSNTSAVTASAAAGTPLGSVQFNVLQLAAANSLISTGVASSTSQIVTSSPDLLVSMGAGQLGFGSLTSGAGMTLGSHTVSVTQSSQAAAVAGTTDLRDQTGIGITTGSNDTVNVTVNGTAYSLTIAPSPSGGYTSSGLLAAVNSAIGAAGASGTMQAGYDASGHLVFSTTSQGSTQSLQVTGGTALPTLGLTAGSSTGVDAVVTLDGTTNTFTTVSAGQSLTLNGPSGSTVTATLASAGSQQYVNSSLLSAGSVTANDVSTGSGSLADVVANINASASGVVASAVQTGTNQYVLQLTSGTTGVKGNISIDPNAFASSSLGGLKTAVAGQDAELQIGGTTGYTISSANNTFTGLLPGLSITAQQVTASPVTVTVGSDSSSIASSVGTMVSAANTALADLQKYAGYNATTKVGGPLMGSAILQNLTNSILAAVASVTGSSSLGSAANVGIKLSNGSLTFDQTAFEAAYNANPSGVQNLFTKGGTFSPLSSSYTNQVSFSYATLTTKPGSYDVTITQSATQASGTGATLSSGAVTSGETLSIGMGSGTATYTTSAGETLSSIADGLNAAFASQGMGLSARIVAGNQLQLVSTAYGSKTSFTVSTTNSGAGTTGLAGGTGVATYAGTDVAGTINGVAATGDGQFLDAPTSDPTLAGLSLRVTTPGITTSTDLGTFSYKPGLAQVLSSVADSMSNPVTGAITQTVQGLQTQSASLSPQITMYQKIVDQEQKLLMAKYATMEATLGTLKNQSSALASQLAKIAAG